VFVEGMAYEKANIVPTASVERRGTSDDGQTIYPYP
jgi:hypothetical protein